MVLYMVKNTQIYLINLLDLLYHLHLMLYATIFFVT